MYGYAQLPHEASVKVSPFHVAVSRDELQDFHDLIRLSKLGPRTYENSSANGRYGVTYEWMSEAKAYWESRFDWSAVEDRINEHPNFKANILDDDGSAYAIHFTGLFSQRKDAIPLMCIHGWPGSFLEFTGILSRLKQNYSPQDLPYHIVIPSLPGYAFSDSPPLDKNWTLQDSGRLLHKLMVGLGFGDGYALQGGDIGSYTARIMAATYDSCKVLHLNFCVMTCPAELENSALEEYEREGLKRADRFGKLGTAYAVEHATRTATIGFVLSSSPLALLAWYVELAHAAKALIDTMARIGEKFLAWTDQSPSMDEILSSVTLYWLTQTFPRAIYPYRQEIIDEPFGPIIDAKCRKALQEGPRKYMVHPDPKFYCHQPMGYSYFPCEIAPVPKSWAATTGNLVWFNRHDKGGHFAALEQPEALLSDIEEFLKQAWR
ncbi:epoxide hydrolase [Colletotrichum karsti]|uniref:Epoxide hydrolase n=1 Tax=Colletotrichum karsti TaxID=1095194 RepID=A0A9P6LE92_9PEZI|nr:epoxide hydrolase [Colletotrichum karsti]KAF9872909.1 epoxide hydrolase [Colletotrichum karsti]